MMLAEADEDFLQEGERDKGVDQIGPNIVATTREIFGCKNPSSSAKSVYQGRVSFLIDEWMETWGEIPNADLFLTDALAECLLDASSLGLVDAVQVLLRLGADPDYEETYYQIRNAQAEALIPAYRFPVDEFQGLPFATAEECDFSRRCLHVAVESNAPEVLGLLLRFGADINATEKPQLQTALHDAARVEGRLECLKLLVEMGADINALDFNGHTALYRTLKVEGDRVTLNLKGAEFLVARDVKLQGRGHLMKVSRIMAMRSISQETFLALCDFVKILLDHGVKLDERTANDDPLLWYCFTHFEKHALEMVSLLLNRGACNPHSHFGSDISSQVQHTFPCSTKRPASKKGEGSDVTEEEKLRCFDLGVDVVQHSTLVNFILFKLATLLSANKDNPASIEAALNGASASLGLLLASIDATRSDFRWRRDDDYNEAWSHAERLKVSGNFSSEVTGRVEALTSWVLRERETRPATLKELTRHWVRKAILRKREKERREKREKEKRERERKDEREDEDERDKTEKKEDDDDDMVGLYIGFEDDIMNLPKLAPYLRRYLLFQS